MKRIDKSNNLSRLGKCLLASLVLLLSRNACIAEDALSPSVVRSKFTFEKTKAGYLIREGASPVLFYQQATKSKDGKWPRANYVHPLYDLDGQIVTQDFPSDHGHHRGIFWTWHQVLIGDKQIGDAWECKKFRWDVRNVSQVIDKDTVGLDVEVDWLSPDWVNEKNQPQAFVNEQTSIRVHSATTTHRMIDFTIRINALVPDFKLGGSKDAKGYGGFSPRIRLNKTVKFSGAEGELEPLRTAIDAGRWVDITGEFSELPANDSPTTSTKLSGMTILAHPSIPGFPRPWILRRAGSMQNPVFPGNVPVEVPMDKPLVLKYRLVLHRGMPSTETINKWQDAFEG
jgi:hypothetical protein